MFWGRLPELLLLPTDPQKLESLTNLLAGEAALTGEILAAVAILLPGYGGELPNSPVDGAGVADGIGFPNTSGVCASVEVGMLGFTDSTRGLRLVHVQVTESAYCLLWRRQKSNQRPCPSRCWDTQKCFWMRMVWAIENEMWLVSFLSSLGAL